MAIWVALLIGCGAYYSSPSDFLYVRRSMLALVFFATSFWTVERLTGHGAGGSSRLVGHADAVVAHAPQHASLLPVTADAAPASPARVAPDTATVESAPWYERSIKPSLFIFGDFLGVGSFVAVDWLDALNDCDRWLLAGRRFAVAGG